MKKFEIVRDKNLLTDEKINRHKNFDKLIADHTKRYSYKEATKPLYKNKKFLGLMILISIVTLVIVIDSNESEYSKKNIQRVDSLNRIKPDSLVKLPK